MVEAKRKGAGAPLNTLSRIGFGLERATLLQGCDKSI